MPKTITGTLTIDGVSYAFTATADGAAPAASQPRSSAEPTGGKLPDLPDRYETRVVRFTRSGSKGGESARGKWMRFFAKDEDSDTFFSTFDTNLGAELKRMADSGLRTRIAFVEGEKGCTFVGYPVGGEEVLAPGAKAAPPPAGTPAPAQPAPAAAQEEYDASGDSLPF
jgi:hypothetical protein